MLFAGVLPAQDPTGDPQGMVEIRNISKLVFSAHSYGPSLFVRAGGAPRQFWEGNFPVRAHFLTITCVCPCISNHIATLA